MTVESFHLPPPTALTQVAPHDNGFWDRNSSVDGSSCQHAVLVLFRRIQVNEQRECYVIYVSHNFASAAIKDDAVGVLGKANIKHIFLSEKI